jgi:hypothetical protein
MTDAAHSTVVLRDERNGADSSFLRASIESSGDLVLEGHDMGPTVEQAWSQDEYEYWRRVQSSLVPKVLLELIKDRFKTDAEFDEWLKEKGIPSEFHNWF